MRQAIVAEARAWIGTPYLHGASHKQGGCDCLGLLRGIWRAVEGAEPVAVPRYTADWDEPQRREVLLQAVTQHLGAVPLGDAAPGDVLLFRMKAGGVAKHLGVQTEVGALPCFVHAYSGHGVVEAALSLPWARRVVGRFRFPSALMEGAR